MFTRSFVIAAGERALKTFAQTALSILGAEAVDLLAADWVGVLSVAAGAAVVSLLTSIVSGRYGYPGPSLTSEVLDEYDVIR